MMSEGKEPGDGRGEGEGEGGGGKAPTADPTPSSSADLPTTRPASLDDESLAAGRRSEESPESLLGRVLSGRYRIEAHLGAGGFGDVFRAVQEKTGQLVAIKLLRPRYGKSAPSLER